MSSNLYLGPDKKVDCMRTFWGQQLERLLKTLQLPFHFIFIILFFRHYLVFPFQSQIEKFFASNLDNFEKFANTTFLDKTTLAKIFLVEVKENGKYEEKYFSFWRSQDAGFFQPIYLLFEPVTPQAAQLPRHPFFMISQHTLMGPD